jgi:tetratricopeptide (TPR) repeat protein
VAGLLEQQGAEEPRLWPPLARHFEAAGEDGKASHYLWSAAEDARAKYDNTSAFDFLGRYVALGEKAGADPADDVQFRKGLLYLAEASKELGRLDEADTFSDRILEAVKTPCPETAISFIYLANNQRRRGAIQRALDLFGEAMKIARLLDSAELTSRILIDSGIPLAMLGHMDEAKAQFQEAESLARKLKIYSDLVYALMNQGLCHYHGGAHYAEALAVLKAAREVARRHGLKPPQVTINLNLTQVLFDAGRYQEALGILQEGLAIAKQFGYRHPYVGMMSNLGLDECMLGLWEEARESAENALSLAQHYKMTYSCGANRHTLGLLAAQSGDIERCFANQSGSLRDHLKANYIDSARAALSEILMVGNGWRVQNIGDSIMKTHAVLVEGLDTLGNNAYVLGLRVQLVMHGLISGAAPKGQAEQELRRCLAFAVKQGTPWLQSEIGEALVTCLGLSGQVEEACDAGQALLPMLGRHYCPLKVPSFLLALASAQERAGRWEALKPVIRALRRYEKTLDRGLTGMSYHALLSRVAQRAGRKKVARERRERAVQIAQAVLDLQKSSPYREAFLALPDVRELLKS